MLGTTVSTKSDFLKMQNARENTGKFRVNGLEAMVATLIDVNDIIAKWHVISLLQQFTVRDTHAYCGHCVHFDKAF